MNYTWGEIQVETLKKLFLTNYIFSVSDLAAAKYDKKYCTYLDAMPQAANEAISELVKRSRPYLKMYDLTQLPITNLLEDIEPTKYDGETAIEFIAEGALSYYFEVDNFATIKIYKEVSGTYTLLETINNEASIPGTFTAYKGYIDNSNGANVKIEFSGTVPYYYANVALYEANYNTGDDDTDNIPNYRDYNKYDLKTLLPDFYKINKLYYGNKEIVNNTDYMLMDNYTLILPNDGRYTIIYEARPSKLTTSTSSEYVLPLEFECTVILPLYIASQVYKDDDISLSTQYRNEFEVALEDLYPGNNDLKFTNSTGWL